MFEIAEVGQTISNEEYKERVPDLRIQLVDLQHRLKQADFSVVIVLSGFETAGRSETLHKLYDWMDPRFLKTHSYDKPSDEEAERPYFWRFWRALPPHGRIGIFFGSWYTLPALQRLHGKIDDDGLDAAMKHIATFEQGLANNGTLLLKFWLHLSKEKQAERVKIMEKDPLTRWRVQPIDKLLIKHYDEFRQTAERALRQTNLPNSSWTIVDGFDPHYRYLSVATHLATELSRRLDVGEKRHSPAVPVHSISREVPYTSILDSLDLTQQLSKKKYEKKLPKQQGRLFKLTRKANRKKVSMALLFEGWDAAGKGGIVRRLVAGIDPRDYTIIPVAAPTDEEKAHHYLWRFWRRLPRAGHVALFDRSWYGRVLVERVEGFACEEEWQRAYKEINDFELQLCEHGYVLLKFWLHISKDEQLKRFEKRQNTPYKQFKITQDDWRNREKWDLYDRAVNDMVERCSTEYAPWHLIEANDKHFARIKVLKTVADALKTRLS